MINYLEGNSCLLVKFQTLVISKASMKRCKLFYTLIYCDFKRNVPHPSAQAFAGWRYKCIVYYIYPLTCIFSVCSIFVPTYVGLVGNLINTMIVVVCIPLQAKPKSDHRVTEHSKYLLFLINSTCIGMGDWYAVRTAKGLGIAFKGKKVSILKCWHFNA